MRKRKIICIIMGGGRGSRLFPLTKERCKPAVPLAGKYRLVDIPISNCLNSGYNRIYLLTQFNTASLHRHIQESYKFDPFAGGRVDILSAEQTDSDNHWYQGTADAVRQNLHHFGGADDEDLYVILSGDQLYHMDLQDVVHEHIESGAELTIAAKPLAIDEAKGFGLMRVDDDFVITGFVEKPNDPGTIKDLSVGKSVLGKMKDPGDRGYFLASMGIYIFNSRTLHEALNSEQADFGKDIIPGLLGKVKMHSYIFDGYWEDIGTVKAYFDCNLRLTDPAPPFNFFDDEARIFTHARYLGASKLNDCNVHHAIVADGCIVTSATLTRCSLGIRSIIREQSTLESVVMIGADYFETPVDIEDNRRLGRPDIGVGKNCRIHHAILDKNVRIGHNVVLDATGLPDNYGPDVDIAIRDGVIVVNKGTIIPDNYALKA